MLTLPEKILFTLAALASLTAVYRAILRIVRTLSRGKGKPDWSLLPGRLVTVFPKVLALQPTYKIRFWPNLFHILIVWGFLYFLLVNLSDLLHGFLPDFHLLGQGSAGQLHRLLADLASVSVLAGMLAMIIRRFVFQPATLTARQDVLLHPKARFGIWRDSAIVGSFVLVHVGSRLLEQSFNLAREGLDPWQPFATRLAGLWAGASPASLLVAEHIAFWLAEGAVLAFLPYFLYSKHIHMFFAPLNFMLKPPRRSIGELSKLDFNDESVESFGATRLEDLGWEQLMDAYACIQCYRCQQVCPAYNTGKVLSPAALEINKRYFLNEQGARLIARRAKLADTGRVRHPRRGHLGLHCLRRLYRYLPGQQRADARYPGYPPLAGVDGKQLPQPAPGCFPWHGTQCQSLEYRPDRAHEMG